MTNPYDDFTPQEDKKLTKIRLRAEEIAKEIKKLERARKKNFEKAVQLIETVKQRKSQDSQSDTRELLQGR